MPYRYDKQRDILTIVLSKPEGEVSEFEGHGFSILVDDSDQPFEIEISSARQVIANAIKSGIPLPDNSAAQVKPAKSSWEDVDSSMISAFKYDEVEGTLDVAFNNSGVYRYVVRRQKSPSRAVIIVSSICLNPNR